MPAMPESSPGSSPLQTDSKAQLLRSQCYWKQGQVSVQCANNVIYLKAHQVFNCMSSAVYGGGSQAITDIANFQVPTNYDCRHPKQDVRRRLLKIGIDEPRLTSSVGFLTAARVSDAGWSTFNSDDTDSWALLTCASVGTANRMRVPRFPELDNHHPEESHYVPGTINIIVLVAGQLTPEALIGGIITATEAKCAALADLRIEVQEGVYATGTSTDAILLGATGYALAPGGDHPIEYAGLATPFGAALGSAVYESVFSAGTRYLRRQDAQKG